MGKDLQKQLFAAAEKGNLEEVTLLIRQGANPALLNEKGESVVQAAINGIDHMTFETRGGTSLKLSISSRYLYKKYGVRFLERVQTPKGNAMVYGASDTNLYFLIEDADHLLVFFKDIKDKETLANKKIQTITDKQPIKIKKRGYEEAGEQIIQLSTEPSDLTLSGLQFMEHVSTPCGLATVCGVDDEGDIWYLIDGDPGVSYWEGCKSAEDVKKQGITPCQPDKVIQTLLTDSRVIANKTTIGLAFLAAVQKDDSRLCERIYDVLSGRNLNIIEILKDNSLVDPITGNTLLHIAAENNNKRLVRRLLKSELDPTHCNKKGKSPRELATNEAVRNILEKTELARFQKLLDECLADKKQYPQWPRYYPKKAFETLENLTKKGSLYAKRLLADIYHYKFIKPSALEGGLLGNLTGITRPKKAKRYYRELAQKNDTYSAMMYSFIIYIENQKKSTPPPPNNFERLFNTLIGAFKLALKQDEQDSEAAKQFIKKMAENQTIDKKILLFANVFLSYLNEDYEETRAVWHAQIDTGEYRKTIKQAIKIAGYMVAETGYISRCSNVDSNNDAMPHPPADSQPIDYVSAPDVVPHPPISPQPMKLQYGDYTSFVPTNNAASSTNSMSMHAACGNPAPNAPPTTQPVSNGVSSAAARLSIFEPPRTLDSNGDLDALLKTMPDVPTEAPQTETKIQQRKTAA